MVRDTAVRRIFVPRSRKAADTFPDPAYGRGYYGSAYPGLGLSGAFLGLGAGALLGSTAYPSLLLRLRLTNNEQGAFF